MRLGFRQGDTGTRYRIGANLARLETDLICDAVADAMPASPSREKRGGCARAA